MAHPAGESIDGSLRVDFDHRLMLQFCGSVVTSDAGPLASRELDNAFGLTAMAPERIADARTGKNGRHRASGTHRLSDRAPRRPSAEPCAAIPRQFQ